MYPAYHYSRISVSCITCSAILWPILLTIGITFLVTGGVILGLCGEVSMISLLFLGSVTTFASIFLAIYLSMQGCAANNRRAMFCPCTKDGKKDLEEIARKNEEMF